MKMISQVLDTELKKGALRIAFATSDDKTINEHFGWADCFVIFDATNHGYSKVGKIKFLPEEEAAECNPENKHFEKINALETCHIIYSQSIGGPVAARLTQKKIHPMVAKHSPTIVSVLEDMVTMLKGPMPPWVRKLTGLENPMRFSSY